jgi:type I restriction enzyme M protein
MKVFRNNTLDLFTQQLIPFSLSEAFKKLYYYLYSNSNIPRAERLGGEMIKLLFCKIYDELNHKNRFKIERSENDDIVAKKIKELFKEVKKSYSDVFGQDEKIYLDSKSVKAVVSFLQNYSLTNTERDAISESFQAFWGPGLRGEKGQFFTPRNVVRMCVKMLNPKPGDKVIDPACGSGGFLIEVLSHLNEKEGAKKIFGIDKEVDLVKICKAYMAIVGDGHSNIFCADSLDPESWGADMKKSIQDETFDIVLTNPPFGAKIFVDDGKILKNFKLAHKWTKNREGKYICTSKVIKQVPQILFIERCLQLLKPGGRMAIVLPDGLFGNPSDSYIWEYVLDKARILAIVSLPPETFLPSTHTKTSVLFLEKKVHSEADKDYPIFMAIAEKVGHDKNGKIIFRMDKAGRYILDHQGNKIIDDDLPIIVEKYLDYQSKGKLVSPDRCGFIIKLSQIKDNIFIPNYYDPEVKEELANLEKSGKYKLVSIGDLEKQRIISIKRGHEVGSKFYGLGNIPFVRTSDIVNWEIKVDPIKCIPEEVYEKYKRRQDIKEWDILLVTDGTFLIGRTAIVTPLDKKIVIQSHIRRIRCLKPNILHPYLLLYLLNTPIVQKQIKEKTFVQATISTIGNRFKEIILSIPTDEKEKNQIIKEVEDIIKLKIKAKQKMDNLVNNKEV